ncbi:MAG: glucose-1-phosphate cytidylyltransferase [Oceanipulchritudo sp.]
MKVVILAGGLGSRLAEETQVRPKPMVEIGGIPILIHIMRYYAHFGHEDFYIALGYKGEMIKKYFCDYNDFGSDMTVDLKNNEISKKYESGLDWLVSLVDTGMMTMTGGRLLRLKPYLKDGPFMLSYGDGVSNVPLDQLLEFHRSHGKLATITAVRPPARYGLLHLEEDRVKEFSEKPQTESGWINGGYFILEPEIFDYIENDDTQWEQQPLERLAAEGQLMAYRHYGYWQCMDTLREKFILERLWNSGEAPWKVAAGNHQ